MFKKLFFLILLIAGCKAKSDEVPPGIIPRDSMVSIMADIHIAESRLISSGSKGNIRDVKSAFLQQVLVKENIDTSRFLKSFDFYSTHPELFSVMYEDVIVAISKRQSQGRK